MQRLQYTRVTKILCKILCKVDESLRRRSESSPLLDKKGLTGNRCRFDSPLFFLGTMRFSPPIPPPPSCKVSSTGWRAVTSPYRWRLPSRSVIIRQLFSKRKKFPWKSDRLLSFFEYNLRHDYAQHPEKKPSRRRIILLCDIISRVSYPKLFPTFSKISRWIYISFHTRKITT